MYCSRRLDFLNNLQSYMVNRKNKKSWDHHVKYTSLDAWTVQKNMIKKSTFLGCSFFPLSLAIQPYHQ